MLVVGAKSQVGNIVHLIVGAESETFAAIHGANIVDITDIVEKFENGKLFVSVTRCSNESETSANMARMGIPFKNTMSNDSTCKCEKCAGKADSKPDTQVEHDKPVVKTAKCEYCSNPKAVLVPIPGHKICAVCAQLELAKSKVGK